MNIAHSLTAFACAKALRSRKLSATALVKHCLDAITAHDAKVHAMIYCSPSALKEAEILDAKAADGIFVGPLHGIPLIIKDNIDVQDMPTTAGSAIFAHAAPATADATAVARLRAAGAIILGKSNTDELAAHVSGTTSYFGSSVNPWNITQKHCSGGSSSGTGVGVVAGFCCGGLGTDTGGSIRMPSGWSGLCGLRPTHGQVDVGGVYPRAVSMDTVGPMARTVQDLELLFSVFANSAMQHALEAQSQKPNKSVDQLHIGIPTALIEREASKEVLALFKNCVAQWKALGAKCTEVDLPLIVDQEVADTVTTIRCYEFTRDVRDDVEASPCKDKLHPVTLSDYVRGESISEAQYRNALTAMESYTSQFEKTLRDQGLTFMLLPSALFTAPPLPVHPDVIVSGRRLLNLFSNGVPTLVMPAGYTDENWPIGMQLIAPRMDDPILLAAGMAYEAHYGPFPMPQL